MTDRKKPGVAFWATVAAIVLVLYPLSYGPACWGINVMAKRRWLRPDTDWIRQAIFVVYFPVRRLHSDGPEPIERAIDWYAHLWY
jgi:hypothetical protein